MPKAYREREAPAMTITAEPTTTYPTVPESVRRNHPNTTRALLRWAQENGVVEKGVDAQATILASPDEGRDRAWCDCNEMTTGEAKDFLGQVMLYKLATTRSTQRFEPGDEVIGIGASNTGTLGVVEGFDPDARVVDVRANGTTDRYRGYVWRIIGLPGAPDVQRPATRTDDVPRNEYEWLRQRFAESQEFLAQAKQQHQDDLDAIGTLFWEEAVRRNWCDEAERFARQVDESIAGTFQTERPARDVDWSIRGTCEVTCIVNGETWTCSDFSWSASFTASDNLDTDNDDYSNYIDIDEAIRSYVYNILPSAMDSDFTIDDYSIDTIEQD
jgi:hypothetical protein